MRYSVEFNPVYYHRFSTSTCVICKDGVRSSKDNKAPLTRSEISQLHKEEAKTASLLRWEEAE